MTIKGFYEFVTSGWWEEQLRTVRVVNIYSKYLHRWIFLEKIPNQPTTNGNDFRRVHGGNCTVTEISKRRVHSQALNVWIGSTKCFWLILGWLLWPPVLNRPVNWNVNHSCMVTGMLHAWYISLIFVTLQSPPPDENNYPLQHRLTGNH